MSVSSDRAVDGLIVTECHSGHRQQGPLILDNEGRVVWFKAVSKRGNPLVRAFNVRVQSYQSEPVLTWFQGGVFGAHGRGHYEIFGSDYRRVAQVHAGNGHVADLHDFVLTDQGTALFTCYDRAFGDLRRFGGPARGAYWYGIVQEVDVATGKVLFQWRSDAHVGLGESYSVVPTTGSLAWDYFHINSIAIDPADGHLVISARNTWAAYKVHRRTGKVLWRLGGRNSDFAMGAGTHFAFQHHVTVHPGGRTTIFDNEGGPPNQASQSRALVLGLDERGRRARFLADYHHHPPVLSPALGSVQELSHGHVFVGWGDSSYFTEFDGDGHVVLDGRLAPGTLSYRAFKQDWTGRPAADPDVAIAAGAQAVDVFVSWNGATEVRQWRVLGGAGPTSLAPLATKPTAGFETSLSVPPDTAWVAVQALDQSGNVLVQTAPRAVSSSSS